MSGPICPDCDLLAIDEIGPNKMRCPICGWEGKNVPRKIMMNDMYMEKSMETRRQLRLREEGKLAYFRVYLKGSDDQKSEATFDIMELMRLEHMSGDDRLVFHIEEKPSPSQIESIKALKGVKRVEVY